MDATGSVSRQLPVAVSQEITSIPGNGQADRHSHSSTYSCSISKTHRSVAQQVVVPPPPSAVRSCTRVLRPFHFAFHFITNFFLFSLLFSPPPSLSSCSHSVPSWFLCRALQIITTATKVSQVQKEALRQSEGAQERNSVGCGLRCGAGERHGHLMKRNDNKLFKHYLRFHISVCQAFPSFLPFLLLFLFLCYFVLFAYFFYSVA